MSLGGRVDGDHMPEMANGTVEENDPQEGNLQLIVSLQHSGRYGTVLLWLRW